MIREIQSSSDRNYQFPIGESQPLPNADQLIGEVYKSDVDGARRIVDEADSWGLLMSPLTPKVRVFSGLNVQDEEMRRCIATSQFPCC